MLRSDYWIIVSYAKNRRLFQVSERAFSSERERIKIRNAYFNFMK